LTGIPLIVKSFARLQLLLLLAEAEAEAEAAQH